MLNSIIKMKYIKLNFFFETNNKLYFKIHMTTSYLFFLKLSLISTNILVKSQINKTKLNIISYNMIKVP